MPRFYQVSLRTILELIFVVAVVLAFFNWRNVPQTPNAGRYQVISGATKWGIIFVDTGTGEMWHGDAFTPRNEWDRLDGPPIKK